jgi:hypothetical protein
MAEDIAAVASPTSPPISPTSPNLTTAAAAAASGTAISPQSSAAANNNMDPALGPLRREGWLTKQGSIVRSWKRRYFSVDETELSYRSQVGMGGGMERNGENMGNGVVLERNEKKFCFQKKNGEKETVNFSPLFCLFSKLFQKKNGKNSRGEKKRKYFQSMEFPFREKKKRRKITLFCFFPPFPPQKKKHSTFSF